jgi:hypothetical protein
MFSETKSNYGCQCCSQGETRSIKFNDMNYNIYQINKFDNNQGQVSGVKQEGLLEVIIPSDRSLTIIHEIDYAPQETQTYYKPQAEPQPD